VLGNIFSSKDATSAGVLVLSISEQHWKGTIQCFQAHIFI